MTEGGTEVLYTYGADLIEEDDGYSVVVPAFPGTAASGDTLKDACENAAGCLQLVIAEYVAGKRTLPEASFDAKPDIVLCVEVTDRLIEESDYMTVTEAADELGVSPGRVSQLITKGQLDSFQRPGGQRMVSVASVAERKANPPAAHRPREKREIRFDPPVRMGSMGRTFSAYKRTKDWAGKPLASFESGGGYEPSVFDDYRKAPVAYEAVCGFGSEERDCLLMIRDDGKFFVTVETGDDAGILFDGGKFVDSLTVYVRTGDEVLPPEYFMG